ncbi:DUF938 domain-containing protein [Glaciecola petra]|uniref:DUF938 domain-containing protein n=1 Tax=Glaciecola petra TaxID=3075602 RepID=A0ABU2ZMH9_9ALTE|nr:DUF938 domain-containing protein [Aestuariibacter sp. P117]MDT0593837.1 DUF938 domain-containing protein [Aestuariibacter sp. P117]
MNIEKPFSQACENNKSHILEVLKNTFRKSTHVLEIGSGTGQHAVHFAASLPHLIWQCADQLEYHPGIRQWIQEYPSKNILAPIELKVPESTWPEQAFDAFFSANTAHIMQANEVKSLMEMIQMRLPKHGVFSQYGPFKVDGQFSSQSNADFHEKLVETGRGGYRDIAELQSWAPNLSLSEVVEMPANNLMLIWHRK